MISKNLAVLAAVSLVMTSTAAMAQPGSPAQSLSLANSRAASKVTKGHSNRLDRRGYGIYIVGAVVLGLAVFGVIELTKKSKPKSP